MNDEKDSARTSNLEAIKKGHLQEAHVPKRKNRFGGTSLNSRHGKMGILDRIRQATSITRVESLLVESQSMGLSAKTHKRVLLASRAVIASLAKAEVDVADVGVDWAKGKDVTATVVVNMDNGTLDFYRPGDGGSGGASSYTQVRHFKSPNKPHTSMSRKAKTEARKARMSS